VLIRGLMRRFGVECGHPKCKMHAIANPANHAPSDCATQAPLSHSASPPHLPLRRVPQRLRVHHHRTLPLRPPPRQLVPDGSSVGGLHRPAADLGADVAHRAPEDAVQVDPHGGARGWVEAGRQVDVGGAVRMGGWMDCWMGFGVSLR